MIELRCPKCQATVKVASENTRVWHSSCPKRTVRGQSPEYEKVNTK